MVAEFWPTSFKEWSETGSGLVTTIAIGVAGFWSYRHFRLRRQRYPRAALVHSVIQRSPTDSHHLLRVILTMSNVGEVLLRLGDGLIRLQQMRPWPPDLLKSLAVGCHPTRLEYPWPLIEERKFRPDGFELEPNETEEFCFDFFLKSDVGSVIIYTYISNKHKRRTKLLEFVESRPLLKKAVGRKWVLPLLKRLQREDIGWQKTTVYDLDSEGEAMKLVTDSSAPAGRGKVDKQGPLRPAPAQRPEPAPKPPSPPKPQGPPKPRPG